MNRSAPRPRFALQNGFPVAPLFRGKLLQFGLFCAGQCGIMAHGETSFNGLAGVPGRLARPGWGTIPRPSVYYINNRILGRQGINGGFPRLNRLQRPAKTRSLLFDRPLRAGPLH